VIDPTEKGVITRTQNVCRGSPKPFNISEQIISNLSAKTIESLSKLDKYEIPSGVLERLKQERPFDKMTDSEIKEIINEFKKFIAILVINHGKDKRVEMVSELVDEVWHTYILFTNEYRTFCEIMVGEYIHHEPNVNPEERHGPLFPYEKKQSTEFFYKEHEKYFGRLPKVWKIRKSTTFEIKCKQGKELKTVLAIVYTSLAFLIPTFLIWQFYQNVFHALIETIILGISFVVASVITGLKIKDKIITDFMFKGSAIVRAITLLFITIFWYICWDNLVTLTYNIFGIMVLQAAFEKSSSGPNRKVVTRSGGIMTTGCSAGSDGGAGGNGCCGGGGCGG
jgi:hypothetical protein